MKDTKVTKVVIEYSDGHKQQVTGKEAEKWDSHCNAVVIMSKVHGVNPFDSDPIKWKKVKRKSN